MPRYSLVNTETANLIGSYQSLSRALDIVAGAVKRYGPAAPEVVSLSLAREDEGVSDEEAFNAEGADLVAKALTAVPLRWSQVQADFPAFSRPVATFNIQAWGVVPSVQPLTARALAGARR